MLIADARLKFDLKEYHEALIDYTRAIEIDRNNVNAYEGRACVHSRLEDFPSALLDRDKLIELDSDCDTCRVLCNRGYKNMLGDYDGAKIDLHKARQLDSDYFCTLSRWIQQH